MPAIFFTRSSGGITLVIFAQNFSLEITTSPPGQLIYHLLKYLDLHLQDGVNPKLILDQVKVDC